jgi:predicted lysophospholipase L1 biosynthesis ABC-type transport system permease subunit
VGRRFQVDLGGGGQMAPAEVIGVVRHLRHRSLQDLGREQLFVSARLWARNPASYIVRTTGDPMSAASAIREVVRGLDPALPVYDMRVLDDYVAGARAPSRFTMVIALTFAGVALLLAVVGVYGVVAYRVGRRAHEFGIRRVLGAGSGSIASLILGDALRLGLVGLVLGLMATFALTRLLSSLLFGVTPYDPVAYGVSIATLGLGVLLASWLPARRAALAPPMDILRNGS